MQTYYTTIGKVVAHTRYDAYDVYINRDCRILLYRDYDAVNRLFTDGIQAAHKSTIVYATKEEAHKFRQIRLPDGKEILLKLYDTPQYHLQYGHYVAWQPDIPIVTWEDVAKSFSGSFSSHSIINVNSTP